MDAGEYRERCRAKEIALARKQFKKIGADPDSQGDILRSLDPECGKKTILAALALSGLHASPTNLPFVSSHTAALTVSGHPASPECLERLKVLCVYKDPEIREIAFLQIADTLRNRGTDFFIDCLKHPKFREKIAAVHSIWRFGGDMAVEAITKRLEQIIRTRLKGGKHYHNGESELTHCIEFLHTYRDRKEVQKTFQKLTGKWCLLNQMEVWWITDQLEYFTGPEHFSERVHLLPGIEKVVDMDHPIFGFVAKGDVQSARQLFEEGTSVYSAARYRSANLWYFSSSLAETAIHNGNLGMLEAMVEFGLNIERPMRDFSRFPLFEALKQKQNLIVDCILDRGIDLNRFDERGTHLFSKCCAIASPEQVGRMIGLGADVSYREPGGSSPFHYAVHNESSGVMELLFSHGADLNAACKGGRTALIESAISGKLKSVEWLIHHGADLRLCEEQGRDALSWAIKKGDQDIVELLRFHLNEQ